METKKRKLDNAAKIFLFDTNNVYRLAVILNEEVDEEKLNLALLKTLEMYPNYKVKLKTGFFWSYFINNKNDPVVEKESEKNNIIKLRNNNQFLFKVTYFKNRINLDIRHVLTDGVGAIIFLKAILYNYLDIRYNLKVNKSEKIELDTNDLYLQKVDKNIKYNKNNNKAFVIKNKFNLLTNKTYHYVVSLKKLKQICKRKKVSITEYLVALYIYALYNNVYDKKSGKDLIVTLPIDLRNYFNVFALSNFFTYMNIEANVVGKKSITFDSLLEHIHKQFKNNLSEQNVKKYLIRDVKLGTNKVINFVPLFIKSFFMKKFGNKIGSPTTTTLSNIGPMIIEDKYKKYVNNVYTEVNAGSFQKIKCTIFSYEDNLNITINTNLLDDKFETKFYQLLNNHIGDVVVYEDR